MAVVLKHSGSLGTTVSAWGQGMAAIVSLLGTQWVGGTLPAPASGRASAELPTC